MYYEMIDFEKSQIFVFENEDTYIEFEELEEYKGRDRDFEKGEIILLKDRSTEGKFMEFILTDTEELHISMGSDKNKAIEKVKKKYNIG